MDSYLDWGYSVSPTHSQISKAILRIALPFGKESSLHYHGTNGTMFDILCMQVDEIVRGHLQRFEPSATKKQNNVHVILDGR